jgi:predicted RNA-binding Zn-ribbon protein involved in translation (DUF1610 family)
MPSSNMEGDVMKNNAVKNGGLAKPQTAKPQTLLNCPNCGRTGVARWVRPESRRQCDLDELSHGFASIDRGTKAGHHFACQRCRRVAVEQAQGRAA